MVKLKSANGDDPSDNHTPLSLKNLHIFQFLIYQIHFPNLQVEYQYLLYRKS